MLKCKESIQKVWERTFLPQEWKLARPTEHSNRLNLLFDCGCWLFLTPFLPSLSSYFPGALWHLPGEHPRAPSRYSPGEPGAPRHHAVLGSAARSHSPFRAHREQTPAVSMPRLKPLRFYRVLIHLDSNQYHLYTSTLCSHTSHIVIKTVIYQ